MALFGWKQWSWKAVDKFRLMALLMVGGMGYKEDFANKIKILQINNDMTYPCSGWGTRSNFRNKM